VYKPVDATEGSLKYSRVLVISAATGLKPEDLEPFLRSLYHHCPRATVVLLVKNEGPEYEGVLRNFNENVVVVSIPDRFLRELLWSRVFRSCWRYETFRKLGTYALTKFFTKLPVVGRQFITSCLHIAFARHFFAKQILVGRYQDVDAVLFSDSRDVFFQRDPFAYLRADLVSGLEDCKVKECPWTEKLVHRNYGSEGLALIGEQQAICSGVTLGTQDAILAYLDEMCNQISKLFARNILKEFGDQGIHNWVIRTQLSNNCFLTPTGHNLIATLGTLYLATYYEFSDKQGLLNKEFEPVAIVHQYDRKEVIKDWCLEKWRRQEVLPLRRAGPQDRSDRSAVGRG
jgi:hypothetical protein